MRDVAYEIHIINGYFVIRLYIKVIQHVSSFKMLIAFVNKAVSIRKSVLKDILIFLVKTYLKLVLDNLREIGYYKVDICNVYIELHEICVKI